MRYSESEMKIIEAIAIIQGFTPEWDDKQEKIKLYKNSQYWHPDMIVNSFRESLLNKRLD